MGLLAPGFLLGALAIGLPLYLHLLRRHSTTPVPFGSLMLFERGETTAVRQRRLRYFLLLALRIALLLALALAFADPYLPQARASSTDRLLVLVVDNSFSMRAGTRLEDAKRAARTVLEGKPAAQPAQVLSLGAQVRLITQPTRDPRVLRGALDSIEPSDARASFEVLQAAARSLADSAHAPLELHLFSDLQQTGMPPSFKEMALPDNVALALHPVVHATEPNWAVESVSAPAQVWDPRRTAVQAVIVGYGTPAAKRTVTFLVNGKTIATREVSVPPSGRATAQIDSLELPYGFSRCAVRIEGADALAADDQYVFTIERIEPKRGLFVHQSADSRSPLFFGTALHSAADTAVALDVVTVDRAALPTPSPYSFVVLSDVAALPATFAGQLAQYVRGGGSVLVALGPASAQAPRVPLLNTPIVSTQPYSRYRERFAVLGDAGNALPLTGPEEQWHGVKFYYAVALDAAQLRVGARLADQTPLIAEGSLGEGRVVLFASGFDNLTNDLPLHPVFVAFVDRVVRYLLGGAERTGPHLVGELLPLRGAKEQGVGVDVIDPYGRRPLALREAAAVQSLPLSDAGFYEVTLATGRHDLIAVNPERRESDLTPMPPDVLALWQRRPANAPSVTAAAAPQAAAMIPRRLWWYAMVVVLLAALAESAFAARYLGTLRESS
jgi:hypothetical protein